MLTTFRVVDGLWNFKPPNWLFPIGIVLSSMPWAMRALETSMADWYWLNYQIVAASFELCAFVLVVLRYLLPASSFGRLFQHAGITHLSRWFFFGTHPPKANGMLFFFGNLLPASSFGRLFQHAGITHLSRWFFFFGRILLRRMACCFFLVSSPCLLFWEAFSARKHHSP